MIRKTILPCWKAGYDMCFNGIHKKEIFNCPKQFAFHLLEMQKYSQINYYNLTNFLLM